MSGGYSWTSIPGISVGSNAITSQVDIFTIIGAHFTFVFISDSHDHFCKLLKETTEALPLNFAKRINLHALVLVYICIFVPLCDDYNICAAFTWTIILSATLNRRSALCVSCKSMSASRLHLCVLHVMFYALIFQILCLQEVQANQLRTFSRELKSLGKSYLTAYYLTELVQDNESLCYCDWVYCISCPHVTEVIYIISPSTWKGLNPNP